MAEYIRQPYVPDQRTMLELMRLAAEDRSRSDLQRAQLRSQGVMNIGELIAGTLASFRQDRERQDAGRVAQQRQEQEDAYKRRDQQLREADLIARIGEREQTTARQRELDQRQATMDAQKAGDTRAKAIGYGPMAEMDVDTVMQSPERAGDVRYIFGPGTADGPELMPTREQQRGIQVEKDIAAMGGKIGPNGQVVMPPRPDPSPSLQRETALVNGKRQFVNFNPRTGAYTDLQGQTVTPDPIPPQSQSSGGPRALTQNAESQLINRLTGQWTTQTKPLREIQRQIGMMDAGLEAAKRGDMAQANEAILQTFLKVLDPNSVVREGEFWRLMQGQSLIQRVKAAMQRIPKGGFATMSELEKYATLARDIEKAVVKHNTGVRARIQRNADRYGIPGELIFDDIEPEVGGGGYLSTDPNFGEPVAPARPKGGG